MLAGSSIKASLGAVSGVVVDVTHKGAPPAALAATHPLGSAGAVTESKFSLNTVPPQVGDADAAEVAVAVAVAVDVAVAVAVAVEVEVAVDVAVAVAVEVGVKVAVGLGVGGTPVIVIRPSFCSA